MVDFVAKTLWVKTEGNFFNYTIINMHAPTDGKGNEVKELFYEE